MKVNKPTQASSHKWQNSQKWKNVRGKGRVIPVSVSDLRYTPVITTKAIKDNQVSVKRKPKVKRLRKKAKSVSGSKDTTQIRSAVNKEGTHTNGSPAPKVDSVSPETRDWSTYAQSVLANVEKTSNGSQGLNPGRLEEDAFHYCAERDDHRNHVVLVLQKDQNLCFRGKCLLTCLYGRVEVMGFTIEEGQKPYPLFSPASHCPLTIAAQGISEDNRDGGMEAITILRKYLSPALSKKLVKRVGLTSSVILLEPIETPLTRFLYSFTNLGELFSPPVSELISAVLDTPLNGLGMVPLTSDIEGLAMSQSYTDALNTVVNACKGDVDGCVVVLVCGTKNVGKSTFNRILINSLLNHMGSIDYLEADLGQTEFTPAGCISLSTVKEPLLGPPFTHQRMPDHMIYYGETSCQADLDRYLESLKSLWSHRSRSRESPIIINTMGWVKGLGLQLLVDMLRLFPVSHVVQLGHGSSSQCPALTPDFLRTAHGCQTHPPPQTALDELKENQGPDRSYLHLPVQAEFQGVGRQGAVRHQRTNEIRELTLLAYLSQLQSSDPGPVRPIHSLVPYQVPHSAVAIGVTHSEVAPNHMLYAANASLVGLCCLGEKVSGRGGPVLLSQAPICPCVGFGVIRGIDMARGLYYLLTPVDPAILRKVNCFLLGAILLPSCILTTQVGCEGEEPYVTPDYSFELTGAGKMRVFKGLIRPGHIGT